MNIKDFLQCFTEEKEMSMKIESIYSMIIANCIASDSLKTRELKLQTTIFEEVLAEEVN